MVRLVNLSIVIRLGNPFSLEMFQRFRVRFRVRIMSIGSSILGLARNDIIHLKWVQVLMYVCVGYACMIRCYFLIPWDQLSPWGKTLFSLSIQRASRVCSLDWILL